MHNVRFRQPGNHFQNYSCSVGPRNVSCFRQLFVVRQCLLDLAVFLKEKQHHEHFSITLKDSSSPYQKIVSERNIGSCFRSDISKNETAVVAQETSTVLMSTNKCLVLSPQGATDVLYSPRKRQRRSRSALWSVNNGLI